MAADCILGLISGVLHWFGQPTPAPVFVAPVAVSGAIFLLLLTSLYSHLRGTLVKGRRNHDGHKVPYASEAAAVEAIHSMRMHGIPNCGNLRVYYNPEYKAWFVGNLKSR